MLQKSKATVWIIQLVILLNCNTPQPKSFPPPTDYQEVLKDIETQVKIEPVQAKRVVLNKAKEAIQNQSEYANECFKKLEDFEKRLTDLEKANDALRLENEELKEELSTWRNIKIFTWGLVVIAILSILWKFLSPIVVPIIKRFIGIP